MNREVLKIKLARGLASHSVESMAEATGKSTSVIRRYLRISDPTMIDLFSFYLIMKKLKVSANEIIFGDILWNADRPVVWDGGCCVKFTSESRDEFKARMMVFNKTTKYPRADIAKMGGRTVKTVSRWFNANETSVPDLLTVVRNCINTGTSLDHYLFCTGVCLDRYRSSP